MASTTPEQEMINSLKNYFNDIKELNTDEIISQETYENYSNYKMFYQNYRRSLKLFKELSDVNVDDLPTRELNELLNIVQRFYQLSMDLKVFKPYNLDNPQAKINQLIEQVKSIYDNNYKNFVNIISYSNSSSHNFKLLEEQLKNKLTVADKLIEETLAKVKISSSEIDKLTAEHAISPYATSFKQLAKNHRLGAYGWLCGGITFLIAALYFGYYYNEYLILPKDFTPQQLIQNSIIKLTIISATLTGLALCVKNYKVNRHNYIINTHRVNSLSTFRMFLDAADVDDLTKKTFLIQAAQSIFSTPNTGYISIESDGDSSNKVIEIFRSVSDPIKNSKP